jgi:hypothetical protein
LDEQKEEDVITRSSSLGLYPNKHYYSTKKVVEALCLLYAQLFSLVHIYSLTLSYICPVLAGVKKKFSRRLCKEHDAKLIFVMTMKKELSTIYANQKA